MKGASEKRIWFPAKRYGWGWGLPCAWQGWVVLGIWILLMVAAGIFLLPVSPTDFEHAVWILALLLMAVCWWKGEKPRWHWGKG